MMLYRLRSLLRTSMAYNGGINARHAGIKHKVVLVPGVNDLTRDDRKLLSMDEAFEKQFRAGFYVEMDEPPTDANGLRTDGPTLREYQAAGYHPDTYPPAGFAVVADPANEPAPAEAAPAPAPDAPPVDPRARLEGEDDETYKLRVDAWQAERRTKKPKETKAAYEARMAAYDLDDAEFFKVDDLTAEQRTFVVDFYAMTQEEQDALRPTLSEDEAALLDANKPEGTA